MPFLRFDGVVLVTLLLCVPLQYLLVRYWGHSSINRTYALNQFINSLAKFQSEYLEWESWKKWCFMFLTIGRNEADPYSNMYDFDPDNPLGESPAVEVMKFKQSKGYFAQSPEPRINRSPSIKYRVGQVVVHKQSKYRGVIIGWDEVARAPEEWMKDMYKSQTEWRYMPNYALLVDVRDRSPPLIAYVPEEKLEVVKNMKIIHPALDEYFETFDGAQYIPRPVLKAIYPLD